MQDVQRQIADHPLFTAPVPVTIDLAPEAYARVVQEAGCLPRDAVDERIIRNLVERRFGRIVRSQADVGGWPELK